MFERFVQDDDGRWYLIPANKSDIFDSFRETGNNDGINAYFSQYTISNPSDYFILNPDYIK